MASIPSLAYVIIGAVMLAFSWFVNKTTDSKSLTLFFYIGGALVIIGLLKLVFRALFRKKDRKPRQPRQKNQVNQTGKHQPDKLKGSSHHVSRAKKSRQPSHPSIIACPVCGAKHYDYANYCMKCGARMEK